MRENTDPLTPILRHLRLSAGVFVHANFCGSWAVDTSGARMATFHLIEKGDCWLHVEGESPRRLNPGDLVVFPRDSAHVVSSEEAQPDPTAVNTAPPAGADKIPDNIMLCGYFEFSGRAMWPLLDALPDAVVVSAENRYTGPLIELMVRELRSDGLGVDAVIEFYAHALFVQTLRAASERGFDTGLLSAIGDPRLARALSCFHEAPQEDWGLDRLAAAAHMGRTAFADHFRELVGVTPMRYLQRWRLNLAAEALALTQRSIADIAEESGYSSEAAFRKAFRRELGIAPGKVRRGAPLPSMPLARH